MKTVTTKAVRSAKQKLNLAVVSHAIGSKTAAAFAIDCADILGCRLAGSDVGASIEILRAALAAAEREVERAAIIRMVANDAKAVSR